MEPNKKVENKFVQTYARDIEKVIEAGKSEGTIKNIIHGEEELEKEKRKMSPESKRNKLFIFMSAFLLLVGFFTLFYILSGREIPTVPVERQFIPLIFNDKSFFIEVKDFNKEQIAQSVLSEVRETKVKPGGVEGIYLTFNKKIMSLREFIALIKSSFAPGGIDFVRENFLMGVVNDGSKDFFIILKVRSISDIFEPLRAWEPKMFFDLHGFFGMEITPETKYLLTKEFENGIVQNKNARILFDNDKKIVMMYILAEETSVVFSNTENSAREIMLRLASSRVEK